MSDRMDTSELDLRESDRLYRQLVELSPDAIVILQDDRYAFTNPAFSELFGYDRDDIDGGLSFYQLVDERDQPAVRQRYLDRLAGAELPRTFLLHLIAKDGRRVYCETSAARIDYRGRAADLVFIRDISERERIADDLAAKRRMLELIGVFERTVLNPDLERLVVEALGYLRGAFGSARVSVALADERRGGVTVFEASGRAGQLPKGTFIPDGGALPTEVLRTRTPVYRPDIQNDPRRFEVDRFLLESGLRADFVVPLLVEERCLGTLNCASSRIDGITEEQQQLTTLLAPRLATAIRNAQLFDEIRVNEERIRALLEHSEDVIIIADQHARARWVSPSVARIRGLAPEQIVGTTPLEFGHPEEAAYLKQTFEQILERPGDSSAVEYRFRHGDGSWHLYEGTITNMIDDPRIAGVLINARDVTARRALEEDAQRRERLESLGLLAGGLAHDFNNLLTAIFGNIDVARRGLPADSRASERLRDAATAAKTAERLTQQLLAFARGGAPIKKVIDLERLVREATEFALRGSNVRCTIDAQDRLWPVLADPGQLIQVVHNLVVNADQAMPDGGTISFRLANRPAVVGQPPAGDRIRLTIDDQGPGIAPDDIGRIFDPYYTTKPEGSGLGLSTAYAIVHRHAGSIAVDHAPGGGARFVIELPAEPAGQPAAEPVAPEAHAGAGRILLMDDEEMIRAISGEMLGELGYDVTLAADGEEAVQLYREALARDHRFAAVILDLTVPGAMGGKDAIGRIRELDPTARAIVSSGYSHDAAMANHGEHGFDGMVRKPYSLNDLARVLDEVLGTK